MSILKGFAEISVLIDNRDNVVSPIGELSTDSATFVRGVKIYTNATNPGVSYLNFQALDDSLQPTQVTLDQSNAMLTVISWVNTNAQSGEIDPSQAAFTQLFETQFGSTFSLLRSSSHLNVNGNWYPTSITFCLEGREATDAWTIWFSDELFNNEFDDTTIYVIPPIEDIDRFFSTPTTVQSLLDAVTPIDISLKVDAIRGSNPYTVYRPDMFEWNSLTNPRVKIPTYWTMIIYGRQGNNLDKVKEAIVAYVLANSTHTVEEWGEIFPDIFRSTELIAAPMYFNYGKTPMQTERGIYSAIGFSKDQLTLLKGAVKGVGYTDEFIVNNATEIPTTYRSITVPLVMGSENREGYRYFRSIYGDYLNVAPTHPDFMNMSEPTRQFVMLFNEMLLEAETLTPTSPIPFGYTRVQRQGIWYLAKNQNNLLLLVTTKYSIDQLAATLSLPSDVE